MAKKTISNLLSRHIIVIVSAVYVLVLLIISITSHNLNSDESIRAAQHMLHGTISELKSPLAEVEITTKTVATHVKSSLENPETLELLSQRTVEQSRLIDGFAVIVPNELEGEVDHYSFLDSNRSIKYIKIDNAHLLESDCLQGVLASRKPLWTSPHTALHCKNSHNAPQVSTFCYPILDNDSNIIAIVAAEMPIEWIENKLCAIRPYEDVVATISCGEGSMIRIKDTVLFAKIMKSFEEDNDLQDVQEDMNRSDYGLRRRIGKGRNISFIVYGPMHNGWTLSFICPYLEVMKTTSRMNMFLFFICVFGICLLYFICRYFIRKLTKPITDLSDAARIMAKGDFTSDIPEVKSAEEMINLRDSFVFMQNSLTDYIKELKITTSANERMESELNVARNIQMGMLRKDFPNNLHAIMVPAKEVGGDLYDFVIINDKLYFSIGDVSGKGVPASLMMATTRSALRFVTNMNLPMNQLLSRINNSVADSNSDNMFVTLFVGCIDLNTLQMEYCNAGHNPLVIIPPQDNPYFLKAKANLAVGLFEDFDYESETLTLQPGTRIIAYTDGVNEAEKQDKSLFGNDRLMEWASSTIIRDIQTSNKEVAENLFNAVKVFTSDNTQNDDITIMSITV